MRKFVINVNGKSYDVEVEEIRNGVAVSTPVVSAPVAAPVPQAAPAAAAPAPQAAPAAPKATGSAGSVKIEAPMPGNVLKVNVKVGDTVAEGQAVVVLEAMKMENDIVAPSAGTVASVNVSSGDSVNSGDVLITLN